MGYLKKENSKRILPLFFFGQQKETRIHGQDILDLYDRFREMSSSDNNTCSDQVYTVVLFVEI